MTISMRPLAGPAEATGGAAGCPASPRRHKGWPRLFNIARPRPKGSSPSQQERARDAVSSCCRSDRAQRLQTLRNDLEFLIIGPATATASLNNLEPFNLSTELIAVHNGCYTALVLTRQAGTPPEGDDPKRLGAQHGVTVVLHTGGEPLQHHPHVHCVASGVGPLSVGTRWVACRPDFFLPVRILSRLFRLLMQELQAGMELAQITMRLFVLNSI